MVIPGTPGLIAIGARSVVQEAETGYWVDRHRMIIAIAESETIHLIVELRARHREARPVAFVVRSRKLSER
jgi:hypothetical protein